RTPGKGVRFTEASSLGLMNQPGQGALLAAGNRQVIQGDGPATGSVPEKRLPEPAYPARAGHPLLCRAQKRPHENAAIRLGRPPSPQPLYSKGGEESICLFPWPPLGERGWGEGVSEQKRRWRLGPPKAPSTILWNRNRKLRTNP